MYIYCICASGKLKTNFIKIDICQNNKDIEEIMEFWDDEYGSSYNKHIIEIKKSIKENDLYETLNIKELKLEDTFYILNDKYNFSYYVKKINILIQ